MTKPNQKRFKFFTQTLKKKNEWRIVKFIEKKGTNQKKYIVKMAIIGTKEIIVIFFYHFLYEPQSERMQINPVGGMSFVLKRIISLWNFPNNLYCLQSMAFPGNTRNCVCTICIIKMYRLLFSLY